MWLSTVWLCLAFVLFSDGHLFAAALIAMLWFPHTHWEKRRVSQGERANS